MMELLTDLDRGVDRCCTFLFSRPYLSTVNQGRVFLSFNRVCLRSLACKFRGSLAAITLESFPCQSCQQPATGEIGSHGAARSSC